MSTVGPMASTVNAARNGLRRRTRSLAAPRIGDTIALRRTDALTASVNQSWPLASPRKRIAHRLIA
jgi:hypothetical protein